MLKVVGIIIWTIQEGCWRTIKKIISTLISSTWCNLHSYSPINKKGRCLFLADSAACGCEHETILTFNDTKITTTIFVNCSSKGKSCSKINIHSVKFKINFISVCNSCNTSKIQSMIATIQVRNLRRWCWEIVAIRFNSLGITINSCGLCFRGIGEEH